MIEVSWLMRLIRAHDVGLATFGFSIFPQTSCRRTTTRLAIHHDALLGKVKNFTQTSRYRWELTRRQHLKSLWDVSKPRQDVKTLETKLRLHTRTHARTRCALWQLWRSWRELRTSIAVFEAYYLLCLRRSGRRYHYRCRMLTDGSCLIKRMVQKRVRMINSTNATVLLEAWRARDVDSLC